MLYLQDLKVGLPRFFRFKGSKVMTRRRRFTESRPTLQSRYFVTSRSSGDVEFHPTGRRWILRLFIDKEGGVGIQDCEHASREIDRLLDVEDVIDHPYVLEVSSPGLTRSLKRKQDFDRYIGRKCRIITKSLVEGKTEFRATDSFHGREFVEG